MRSERRIDLLVNNAGFGVAPAAAEESSLYAATKHAIEGYSESLDHELRTRGIRVSVIEPADTKTPFHANFLEPDAKLDEYREVRAAVNERTSGSDGSCGPAGRRGRRRAECCQCHSPETPLRSRRPREPPATAPQLCAC